MLEHLKKLGDHIANMDSGSKDAAAIRYALERLAACEASLAIYDRATMSDPPILFAKPGAVKRADKKMLKAAGILIVEIEDPQSVKFTRAHAEVEGTDLLRIAMQTINKTESFQNVREAFGANISNFLAGK